MFRRKRDSGGSRPDNRQDPRLLPLDYAARAEKYGRERYFANADPFALDFWPSEYRQALGELSPDAQSAHADTVAGIVIPLGGWAAYGAAELLMDGIGLPGPVPGQLEVTLASLEFQRINGVWWNMLSPIEHLTWEANRPDIGWLARRDPPDRDEAEITPLPVGEERKINTMHFASDSPMLFAKRVADDRYVVERDYQHDNGGRARNHVQEFTDLYELLLDMGTLPVPGAWAHPELEQFMPYPMPRLA